MPTPVPASMARIVDVALISSADGARASVASSSTSGRGEAGAEERSLLRSAASENVASGSASVR